MLITVNIVLTTFVFTGIVYAGFALGYFAARKKLGEKLFVKSNSCNNDSNNAAQNEGLSKDGIGAISNIDKDRPYDCYED